MIEDKNNIPLVSVLIPTYNRAKYLEIALQSALDQTYQNIEIIICDDSTNDVSKRMLIRYLKKHSQIHYYNNGGNLGEYGLNNCKKCIQVSSGEYINFLNDDDIFYPKKIERMVEYLRDKSISLVTSRRSRIDESGNTLQDIGATSPITTVDSVYNGKELGKRMIMQKINFIGEPTTVLFRKRDLDNFGMFMGRQYHCNFDMASWLSLMLKGKCAYIAEILSSFRVHREQSGSNDEVHKLGLRELEYLLEDGQKAGFS